MLDNKKRDDICQIYEDGTPITIVGFWVNKDIKIGNIEDVERGDLFISKDELEYDIIFEKEGKYLYRGKL